MFVPGKPFQLSLMFVGKAGAYPRVEHLKGDRNKHACLLHHGVSLKGRKFYRIGPEIEDFLNGLEDFEIKHGQTLADKTLLGMRLQLYKVRETMPCAISILEKQPNLKMKTRQGIAIAKGS